MVKCFLCKNEINKYDPSFNQLIIDTHSYEFCENCIDKFTEWRGEVLAKLFPTKNMKKRFLKK